VRDPPARARGSVTGMDEPKQDPFTADGREPIPDSAVPTSDDSPEAEERGPEVPSRRGADADRSGREPAGTQWTREGPSGDVLDRY
jgi:hypothetical protein